jgi:F-type H+-transporting ATPase subunit delta
MAELTTIARPYAEALFEASRGDAAGSADALLASLGELAAVAAHPAVAEVVADPKLSGTQAFDLIAGLVTTPLAPQLRNLLQLLIENQRLAALPAVAVQFKQLKNRSEGIADVLIESAFPLSDQQVSELVAALEAKFGTRLRPQVLLDSSLIGGVRVSVGDQVLDSSVRARLAEMRAVLTA